MAVNALLAMQTHPPWNKLALEHETRVGVEDAKQAVATEGTRDRKQESTIPSQMAQHSADHPLLQR